MAGKPDIHVLSAAILGFILLMKAGMVYLDHAFLTELHAINFVIIIEYLYQRSKHVVFLGRRTFEEVLRSDCQPGEAKRNRNEGTNGWKKEVLCKNKKRRSKANFAPTWCRWWDSNPHGIATNGF